MMTKEVESRTLYDYGVENNELARHFIAKFGCDQVCDLSLEQLEVACCMFQIAEIAQQFLGWDITSAFDDNDWGIVIRHEDNKYALTAGGFQCFHDDIYVGMVERFSVNGCPTLYEIIKDQDWALKHSDEVWFQIARLQSQLKNCFGCQIRDIEDDPSRFELVIPHIDDLSSWTYSFTVSYTRQGYDTLTGLASKAKEAYRVVRTAINGCSVISAFQPRVYHVLRFEAKKQVFYTTVHETRYEMNKHCIHLYVLRHLPRRVMEGYCEELIYALAPTIESVGCEWRISKNNGLLELQPEDGKARCFGLCRSGMISLVDFLMEVPDQD